MVVVCGGQLSSGNIGIYRLEVPGHRNWWKKYIEINCVDGVVVAV